MPVCLVIIRASYKLSFLYILGENVFFTVPVKYSIVIILKYDIVPVFFGCSFHLTSELSKYRRAAIAQSV
jgi:hypothetical protein